MRQRACSWSGEAEGSEAAPWSVRQRGLLAVCLLFGFATGVRSGPGRFSAAGAADCFNPACSSSCSPVFSDCACPECFVIQKDSKSGSHATFHATFLAECAGLKHDIVTVPVLRSGPCVAEILETQRMRSWRLKEWEPRNIPRNMPRRMCRPGA